MENSVENPQAFPLTVDNGERIDFNFGMTLRDYFAAKAMQGMLSGQRPLGTPDSLVKDSYRIADKMLKARQ